MLHSQVCTQCGRTLAASELGSACPACLLQLGLVAGLISDGGTSDPLSVVNPARLGPTFVPSPASSPQRTPHLPLPEALANLFPELEITEVLGHGGMGVVYRARQISLGRAVALKIILPDIAEHPGFADRFTREARLLARLNHPNIVTIYDFGQRGGLYYLLMEYVEGADLRHRIDRGRIPPAEALALIQPLCDALQYAHEEGIVHRDIKPENILIDQKGRVKLVDFGLARLASDSTPNLTLTATRQVVGTPRYMAPEQMRGAHDVDHRADIYSLGIVMYEMLTGEIPMGHFARPSELTEINPRVDSIVLRALHSDPLRRYQSAREFSLDVRELGSPFDRRDHIPPQLPERLAENQVPGLIPQLTLLLICGGLEVLLGVGLLSMIRHELESGQATRLAWLLPLSLLPILAGGLAVNGVIQYLVTADLKWLRRAAIALLLPVSIAWFAGVFVGLWVLYSTNAHTLARKRLPAPPFDRQTALHGHTPSHGHTASDSHTPSASHTALAWSHLAFAGLQMVMIVMTYLSIGTVSRTASMTTSSSMGLQPILGWLAMLSIAVSAIIGGNALIVLLHRSPQSLKLNAVLMLVPLSLAWIPGLALALWTFRSLALSNPVQGPAPESATENLESPRPSPSASFVSYPWSGLGYVRRVIRKVPRHQRWWIAAILIVVLFGAIYFVRTSGNQRLIAAAVEGRLWEIRAWLLTGYPPDIPDDAGMSALMWAAWSGQADVLQQLIAAGAAVNRKGNDGETALMKAAFRGHDTCVAALLKAGASLNEQDQDGETALILAVAGGHSQILTQLLRHNADPQIATATGLTPLMVASRSSQTALVNLLIPVSAINARETQGLNAVMMAAEQGHSNQLRILLEAGGQPDQANHSGQTALDLAVANGHSDCVELLIAKGARPSLSYDVFQTIVAVRSRDYADASRRFKKLLENTSVLAGKLHFKVGGWRYEIPHPEFYVHLLAGECEKRLGNTEQAIKYWKAARQAYRPVQRQLTLYVRRHEDSSHRMVEQRNMTSDQVDTHLSHPQQEWRGDRVFEGEDRSANHIHGHSGTADAEVFDLFAE